MTWVVKQAGRHILRGKTMSALLCMPIQLELATVLVACGARFTFAQLLAAVASRTAAGTVCSEREPGPNVWMHAYRQHGLSRPSGMPAVAEALCIGKELTEDMLVSHVCKASTYMPGSP